MDTLVLNEDEKKGDPVHIRFTPSVLDVIDRCAAEDDRNRTNMIQHWVMEGVRAYMKRQCQGTTLGVA